MNDKVIEICRNLRDSIKRIKNQSGFIGKTFTRDNGIDYSTKISKSTLETKLKNILIKNNLTMKDL